MTSLRAIPIEEAAAVARRHTLKRLLRCALAERLLGGGDPAAANPHERTRVSFETAAGVLQLRCRPPFLGWRHAEIDSLVLSRRGSAPRPLEDPFDLISFLRPLLPDGRWDRLEEEIEDSVQNEALSIQARSERDSTIAASARDHGSATLLDWVRCSLPPAEWTSFIEQWGAVGHPHHPCAKTRIGFMAEDSRRYAPEFGRRVGIPWLAARRHQLAVDAASPNLDAQAYLHRHFPAAIDRWRAAVAASGADPEAYLPLPVHPWQWQTIVTQRFAEEIARGDILKPEGVETECLAMLSLRTLAPVEPALAPTSSSRSRSR